MAFAKVYAEPHEARNMRVKFKILENEMIS